MAVAPGGLPRVRRCRGFPVLVGSCCGRLRRPGACPVRGRRGFPVPVGSGCGRLRRPGVCPGRGCRGFSVPAGSGCGWLRRPGACPGYAGVGGSQRSRMWASRRWLARCAGVGLPVPVGSGCGRLRRLGACPVRGCRASLSWWVVAVDGCGARGFFRGAGVGGFLPRRVVAVGGCGARGLARCAGVGLPCHGG